MKVNGKKYRLIWTGTIVFLAMLAIILNSSKTFQGYRSVIGYYISVEDCHLIVQNKEKVISCQYPVDIPLYVNLGTLDSNNIDNPNYIPTEVPWSVQRIYETILRGLWYFGPYIVMFVSIFLIRRMANAK